MTRLLEILSYLEEKLDPRHLEQVRERQTQALLFGQPDSLPLRVDCPSTTFERFPYAEAFADKEKMLFNELCGLCSSAEIQDDAWPMIRANYGVGTLASLFGNECRILYNEAPWVKPLEDNEAVRRLIGQGVPALTSGLGRQVLDTQAYYREQLAPYPKCRSLIRVYHPDLQGPFDTAHLIWGTEIYYAMTDEPELVHALLDLVTETYIQFMKAAKAMIQDEFGEGFCGHWGSIYRGRIVLRDDTAVNLSPEQYDTFVRPYDQRILEAFGGGSIHYCGQAEQWLYRMMECRQLGGLNFGQPPNMAFGLDFLDKIRSAALNRKIAITYYSLPQDQLGQLAAHGFTTGITLGTTAASQQEALTILHEHRQQSNCQDPRII